MPYCIITVLVLIIQIFYMYCYNIYNVTLCFQLVMILLQIILIIIELDLLMIDFKGFGGRGLHIALAANSVRDPLSARGEPRLCSDKYVLIRQKMLEHGDDF